MKKERKLTLRDMVELEDRIKVLRSVNFEGIGHQGRGNNYRLEKNNKSPNYIIFVGEDIMVEGPAYASMLPIEGKSQSERKFLAEIISKLNNAIEPILQEIIKPLEAKLQEAKRKFCSE